MSKPIHDPLSKQVDEDSCYANKLSKAEAEIDWSEPAEKIQRAVRAESRLLGRATDQDFPVGLLRQVTITGAQAGLQDARQLLREHDLALDRHHRHLTPGGHAGDLRGPRASGVDQRTAAELTAGGAHARNTAAVDIDPGHLALVEQLRPCC